MLVKMTNSDNEKGRLAGLVYDVSEKEAAEYIEADIAVIVEEKPKKVKHGDG